MFKFFCLSACLLCSIFSGAQLTHKLDSLFLAQQDSAKPGFALLIEKDGKKLYQKAGGLADVSGHIAINAASNFRLASVSKQFTAMAVLLLEKAKMLSVEDAIGRYLPELPERVGKQILIRHLLTHTSGIWNYEALIPDSQQKQVYDADVLELLKDRDTTYFSPGSGFRYSNSGFCLLAIIVERVAHQSFASFIKENIFVPLRMDNSIVYESNATIANRAMGYAKDSSGKIVFSDQSITSATKGDGGVYTSLNDYVKWLHALQQNKLLNLPAALLRIRYRIRPMQNDYYAAGWFQTGVQQQVLFHSGSTCGFNNYVIEVPGKKFSILYFTNLADNSATFKSIISVLKESGLGDFSHVLELHQLTN